ncbi:regulator RcnB of Ni and Co efflux [Granulicella rosea]|uniref:Regulator RcnB of Ni and Co efflux n=1 Tax=Granulicella rosea TaxID=474952 RepID=A0A239CRG9_9BACT|nr:RcnB family protein [Granulicella rosea]SNS22094.1 regulator RcnB of Ni and Co efflux [Granulicella rosea]
MNATRKVLSLVLAVSTLAPVAAFAQDHHDAPHDNHAYVEHKEWKKGYHMNKADWARGEKVDYNQYHLAPPPRGYEWRQVDGNYVMAAIATGVIASTIVAASR